jgi:hypothetical protein
MHTFQRYIKYAVPIGKVPVPVLSYGVAEDSRRLEGAIVGLPGANAYSECTETYLLAIHCWQPLAVSQCTA